MLVVQGGPGTGKTVVALHRAAYLLYTHRFPLEDQGVLVIGPNRVFLRYIERVLPSLGEAGVKQVVLADLIPGVQFRRPDEQGDSSEAAKIKGEERMSDCSTTRSPTVSVRCEATLRCRSGLDMCGCELQSRRAS